MSIIIRIVNNFSFRSTKPLLSITSINSVKSYRNFYYNSKLCRKMFLEHENTYAYNIMEKKGYAIPLNGDTEKYELTTNEFNNIMQEDWSKKKPHELFNLFPKLGQYCLNNNLCISNKLFDSFIDNLTDNIRHASDAELESLFYFVTKWPETESIRTRNYIEIWAALDDECLNRLQKWSYDEILKFTSLFFMLNVTRVSEFSQKTVQKLASKAKQLTPGQIVQTLFYVGIMRRSPFDMHNLELELCKRFTEFTLDDLAIMSMGFFKSKTPIRDSKIVTQIINKIMESTNDINEVSLAALLKIIRYSLKISEDDEIYKLQNALQHEVPRLSVMCNVHLALLGTATLTLHEECLNKIAETTITCISEARVKDLERLVLVYGIFNIKPKTQECFLEKVMAELRKPERHNEIEKHGRSYTCCISFLSLLDTYPIDLMSHALSAEFLNKTYGKQPGTYGKEILGIHTTAAIFCPEAKMNRLSDKSAIVLAKKYTDFVPSEDYTKQYNLTESMFLDIKKILMENRGGNEYVLGDHILPHHQKGDIIICNDKNGSPLKIPESFKNSQFGLVRKVPDDNKWIVLVIAGKNAFIHNSDKPTGPFLTKIKELRALGYNAALVLRDDKTDELTFFGDLIYEQKLQMIINHKLPNAVMSSHRSFKNTFWLTGRLMDPYETVKRN